jgi:sugar/nucleoside kinase (ribokinase family)
MNLLVIGHSVVDKIQQGEVFQVKPGGIFYTAISLFNFLEKSDKLFLCTTVDKSNYNSFSFIYNNVEQEFIKISEVIPVVNLILKNSGERAEFYENISERIELDFADLNRFSGILINMITGFDISFEQLQEIRKNFNGLIYFDVHTLSRGVAINFERVFRPVPEFFKWAKCIDILQANSFELKTLSSRKSEQDIVNELLNYGIKQVIITKSSEGSILYYIENGNLRSIAQNALQTSAVNKVGCGDVFGAAYFYNYIRNKSVNDALLYANTAAGISTRYTEVKDFLNLKDDVRKQFN